MTPTTPARAAPSTKYEHRINPANAFEVQVRPRRKSAGNHNRGASWRRYWLCISPAAALRILAMLAEAESERESVVTP